MNYEKACELLCISNPRNYQFNLSYAKGRESTLANTAPLRYGVAIDVVKAECKLRIQEIEKTK